MHYIFFLISFTVLLFEFSCQSQTPESPITGEENPLTSAQQAILTQHIEPFPDATELALALVTGDSVTWVGIRKVAGDLQMVENANHLFEIGSITKVFTAGILARLVADDSLQLDDPVLQFLPVSLRQPEQDGKKIMLRHLANHSSGLPRLPDNFSPADPSNPYADYDPSALYDYLQHQQQLITPPGEQYSYSNLGFGLLGHILTQRMESDYASLLQEYVTAPLAMDRTFVTVPSSLEDTLVPGRNPQGHVTANWDMGVLAGAGAIKSTAHDMVTWIQANINRAEPTGPLWKLSQLPTLAVSEDLSVGLGWHISTSGGKKIHWHNGGTGGYRSCVAFRAESGTGVVILSNVSAFSPQQDQIDALCFRLLETLYTDL